MLELLYHSDLLVRAKEMQGEHDYLKRETNSCEVEVGSAWPLLLVLGVKGGRWPSGVTCNSFRYQSCVPQADSRACPADTSICHWQMYGCSTAHSLLAG